MRYAGIIYNDFSAAPGVCLSFFTQGCPHRCKGCHNPETWDFNGGREFTDETLDSIIKGLEANSIQRDFCIMGGEPLCIENRFLVATLVAKIRQHFDLNIYLWTGYTYEQLEQERKKDIALEFILSRVDVLIDGPYIEEERTLITPMKGSLNQRVINLKDDTIIG